MSNYRHSFAIKYTNVMKQFVVSCLTLTTVLASLEQGHERYAPYFSHGTPGLIDLGEHLDPKSEIKHEYPAGLLFGHGYIDGLHELGHGDSLKGFGSAPLDLNVNDHLTSSFEKNLIAPELPKITPEIKTSIYTQNTPKYTNTPTATYEVREDNFEPIPVPKISTAIPVLAPASTAPSGGMPNAPQLAIHAAAVSKYTFQPPVSLGSGSLGVTNLGNGNFAIGSGSLGYVGNQQQQVDTSGSVLPGGIHQVDAPALGNAQPYGDSNENAFSGYPGALPAEHGTTHEDFNTLQEDLPDFSSYFKER